MMQELQWPASSSLNLHSLVLFVQQMMLA